MFFQVIHWIFPCLIILLAIFYTVIIFRAIIFYVRNFWR